MGTPVPVVAEVLEELPVVADVLLTEPPVVADVLEELPDVPAPPELPVVAGPSPPPPP
ncbi:hypothetical protein [Sorangium cellulosum]|uniref:hypothetical protein n=1 Tax=Sorangium cellulosum TaxID=56 RepID=UPI001F2E5F6D|nr:hypothetical protein [Sorangium cellulosum]